MSIDAIITAVEPHEEGALLRLENPGRGRERGRSSMVVLGPIPPGFDSVIGLHIWGGDSSVMIGSKRWGRRIGYARIKLEPPGQEGA